MNLPEFQRWMDESGGHAIFEVRGGAGEAVYVDVDPEYVRLTGGAREQLIGLTLDEAFPDDGNGGRPLLLASFERAVQSQQPDKMVILRYDIANERGRVAERWWQVDNVPIVEDGAARYMVNRVEDVTLQVLNSKAIQAQKRQNVVLYSLVVLLVGLLALSLTGDLTGVKHAAATSKALALEDRALAARAAGVALQNRSLLHRLQFQRTAVTRVVCHTTNQLVRSLRALILTSVRSGRVFNALFRRFHAPSYRHRLRLAYAQARSLQPLDCPLLAAGRAR